VCRGNIKQELKLEELAVDAVRIRFFRLLTTIKATAKPTNVATRAYGKYLQMPESVAAGSGLVCALKSMLVSFKSKRTLRDPLPASSPRFVPKGSPA